MFPVNKLSNVFDILVSPILEVEPPTQKSIARINDHFQCQLPQSIIDFALKSKSYGGWFTSLGEDYESHNHIIRVNSRCKKIRKRTTDKKWKNLMPKNYVSITVGFDEYYDCFDLQSRNSLDGEYNIVCLNDRLTNFDRYNSFYEYLNCCLNFWLTIATDEQKDEQKKDVQKLLDV